MGSNVVVVSNLLQCSSDSPMENWKLSLIAQSTRIPFYRGSVWGAFAHSPLPPWSYEFYVYCTRFYSVFENCLENIVPSVYYNRKLLDKYDRKKTAYKWR